MNKPLHVVKLWFSRQWQALIKHHVEKDSDSLYIRDLEAKNDAHYQNAEHTPL